MFSLLLAIQTNPLFEWATEAVTRARVATISIEEIFTAHSKSVGTETIASGALRATGWSGSSIFQMWIAANIFIKCTTRIGPHSIAWSNIGCLLNEWISNPSQLLYDRQHQQSSRKSRTKYRFSTTICWIFHVVSDAHRTKWRNNVS